MGIDGKSRWELNQQYNLGAEVLIAVIALNIIEILTTLIKRGEKFPFFSWIVTSFIIGVVATGNYFAPVCSNYTITFYFSLFLVSTCHIFPLAARILQVPLIVGRTITHKTCVSVIQRLYCFNVKRYVINREYITQIHKIEPPIFFFLFAA